MDILIRNKLILLFIFDKMDIPMQESIVVDMAAENEWLTYMECKENFCELLKTNFIANVAAKSNIPRYAITSDGRECLLHFYTEIPESLRDKIKENVKDNRLKYRKKQDYFSDYFKNNDGTYTVVLKIESTTNPLMELRLNIQSRNTAKWIFRTWQDKAPLVYEYISENIIE